MGRRRLVTTLKLQLPAGQATPAPPVGTALGPHGVNLMDFVKAYNEEDNYDINYGLVLIV
jgi:large subunit ribosomal protein L11